MTSLYPEVLWAQRADVLYITVNLTDIKDQNIQLEKNNLKFKANGEVEQKVYEFSLEFFEDIDPQKSKQHLTARSLFFVITRPRKAGGRVFLRTNPSPTFSRLTFPGGRMRTMKRKRKAREGPVMTGFPAWISRAFSRTVVWAREGILTVTVGAMKRMIATRRVCPAWKRPPQSKIQS